jgi:hypothetical protein
MTNKTFTWIGVGLLILLGAFLYWGGEQIFKPEKPVIKSDTIVKYKLDTIKFAVKEPIYKTFHVHDTTLKEVKIYDTTYLFKSDSVQIVKSFFEKRNYQRDIVNDSDLFVSLSDTVSQNQLFGGIGKYVIKRPFTQINNNPMQPLKSMLFIGAQISTYNSGFGLGGRITYKSKKDQLYHIGIEYYPYLINKPILTFGTDIKIKL